MNEKISLKKTWVSTDGWRGYEMPIHAVCGVNDTGSWDDSPCPTKVAMSELRRAKTVLRQSHIPHRMTTCRSSNVFCVHHYLVVPEADVEGAKRTLKTLESNCRLLYVC